MMQVHHVVVLQSQSAHRNLWRTALRGRVRHFSNDIQHVQEAAKEVLARSRAPRSAKVSADACRDFLSAYSALGAQDRVKWWARQAMIEQESQLEALGRALPRGGGRLAPQLLDSFTPAAPGATEVILRQFVTILGASAGLPQALQFRTELRAAAAAVGARSPAGFALERLDRRLQDVLSLWFSPGFVEIHSVDHDSASEVQQSALAVARTAHHTPELFSFARGNAGSHHRCFALRHPQMHQQEAATSEEPAPAMLLCAHAALLSRLPETLAEVDTLAPVQGEPPGAACFWALASAPATVEGGSLPSQGLRGLGLGTTLLQEASKRLRAEAARAGAGGDIVVGALTPLRGFGDWLRRRRAWEGLEPPFAGALQRTLDTSAADTRSRPREIRFVDVDGDSVFFCMTPERGLEVSVGEAPLSRIVRIRVSEDNRYVRFLTAGANPTALQVEAPTDVAERGDLADVALMAEVAGILPIELRDPLLRLGNEFLLRKATDGKRLMDPIAHFHLIGGASLRGLLWRADESPSGLAESLGFMASFVYEPAKEAENAALYLERGFVAKAAEIVRS